jgi:hypothetical protein
MALAGTYTFTNVASNSTVRCYKKGEAIFVSPTLEAPGPFELVRIRPLQFVWKYYVLIISSVGTHPCDGGIHHQERRPQCVL